MTNKELRRLSRQELLQLLLALSEDFEELKKNLADTKEELGALTDTYERLRKRLDSKDEKIHRLQDALEAERNRRSIELSEAGNIAEAALRLNGIFEAAQRAADQYLYNMQTSQEERLKLEPEEDPELMEKDNDDDLPRNLSGKADGEEPEEGAEVSDEGLTFVEDLQN